MKDTRLSRASSYSTANVKTWTVSTRISLGFAALVACTVLLGVVNLIENRGIETAVAQLTERSLPGLSASAAPQAEVSKYPVTTPRRLLAADARLIPSVVRMFGVPVTVPEEHVSALTFTGTNTERWSAWYGIDLGPLAGYAKRLRQRFTALIEEAREWPALSEPILLAELDLATVEAPRVDVVASGTATAAGEANAAIGFFEAQLSPGVVLSTNPALEPAVTSWGVPVWLLPTPVALSEGQEVTLEYAYDGAVGRLRLSA